jgi:ABC-type lipoprotein release transport system permease subunit
MAKEWGKRSKGVTDAKRVSERKRGIDVSRKERNNNNDKRSNNMDKLMMIMIVLLISGTALLSVF